MRATILTALCVVGLAPSAHAQSDQRLRISISAADQVSSRTLTQNFTVPINVESAPIATSIDLASAPMFDIGGSYRFLSRLAAGVSVSSLSRDVDGTVDATIPHPFFFNTLRPISGNLSGLQHKEMGSTSTRCISFPWPGSSMSGCSGDRHRPPILTSTSLPLATVRLGGLIRFTGGAASGSSPNRRQLVRLKPSLQADRLCDMIY